ncbi:hypothetical protein D7S86_01060 [Pararobbsia silviterrae]|uniref:Uncharacterized protein n=1 Tax=Pararobbsia silviterrae TaxID=1792498 RepID=A0A494YA22_9BURK|nr:hypothetical protein D7S86_01060 [Pararobbsia silviterrae]
MCRRRRREPRAESREPRAESQEPRAKSQEPRRHVAACRARIKKPAVAPAGFVSCGTAVA